MHEAPDTQISRVAELARLVNCLGEEEFAILAGVKLSTVDAWRKRGKGPEYSRLGSSYLYPIEAVRKFIMDTLRTRNGIDASMTII